MKPVSLIVKGSFALAAALVASPAFADVYHVSQKGDTLSTIAARYRVSSEVLRSVNKLNRTGDADALPAMILRVPDGKEKTRVVSTPKESTKESRAVAVPFSAPTSRNDGGGMSGTISRSLTYTVEPNDSWESIAARHLAAGYKVTAQGIQARNGSADEPLAGSTISVPLQSTTYRAPATRENATRAAVENGLRTISSDAPSGVDGAQLSGEMQGSTWLPTAREVPSLAPPVYRAPGMPVQPQVKSVARKSNGKPAVRGPISLPSRGYTPGMDGARVLGPQEDAPIVGQTPQPRMRTVAPPKATPSRLAYVAKIANNNARIRRLPDAEAATLYRCATGTEIAVIKQSGNWSAILMSDRSTGWLPTRYLRMTGQSVDISSQVITDSTETTIGGRAVSGNFSSDNPMVAQALTWLGTPYVYGGESRRGIDCSALVQNSFATCGYRLPRTAAQQARVGTPVNPAELKAGDRLYFSASGSRVDHTGLYMGDGLFVHASGSGRGVIVSRLSDRRNWNIFVGARRS